MTANQSLFYIDGAWVAPDSARLHDVIDPATESPMAAISLGSAVDVDRAVAAAKVAFPNFSATSVDLMRWRRSSRMRWARRSRWRSTFRRVAA